MWSYIYELSIYTSKLAIFFIFIMALLVSVLAIIAKSKQKLKDRLQISDLSESIREQKMNWLSITLPKPLLKAYLKEESAKEKAEKKLGERKKTVFVMDFVGDIKASSTQGLMIMINSILQVAEPNDEVVLRLESAGGVVHGYGLATATLMRLRAHQIQLTVTIDKVAASGGYLMACVADRIIAAPFAIVGSIGVIVQLPNFNRLLKEKNIDFEQHTAGEFKRTLSVFGENTDSAREKLQQEIEVVHSQFKHLIQKHRPQIDIAKVATGEYWHGEQAISLNLIDELQTSDDYLMQLYKDARLLEVSYEMPKSLLSKILGTT